MDRSQGVWEALLRCRSIALLAPETPEVCLRAYELLSPLGIVLEVALRTPAALPGLRLVLENHPDALLLAGTVLARSQAREAAASGAAGIVSPDFIPGVVEVCAEADVMCVPGGLADCGKQLALKAEVYGCSLHDLRHNRPWQWAYKVFPAAGGGEGLRRRLEAWRDTYPGVRYLYTGGVTPENLREMAREDPEGIFCASALVRKLSDPEGLREDVGRWLQALESAAPESGGAGPTAAPPSPVVPGTVVTFGEIMLRLSPSSDGSLKRPSSFRAHYGGAEANVAAALASWGVSSRYVTALPENDLAEGALAHLRGFGVDLSEVLRSGDRMGLYFLEPGSGKASANLLYDRRGSAVAALRPGAVPWRQVLTGASWFHWTGITPALGPGPAELLREGLAAAREEGLAVSLDLNYRPALWSVEEARATLLPFMDDVDILVGNHGQLAAVFGLSGERRRAGESAPPQADICRATARALAQRFGLRTVVLTYRVEELDGVRGWGAFLLEGDELLHAYSPVPEMVDGVGGGDAFAAGFIYGTLSGMGARAALDFGVAASCLKQSRPGDILRATANEILALVE
jgi:2-dehydro-3-deoxygluconokinase